MSTTEAPANGPPVADGAWGVAYELLPGQTQSHELSETRLQVTRLEGEWQLSTETLEHRDDRVRWTQSVTEQSPEPHPGTQRFIRPDSDRSVCYLPALASLPTVIRPYAPLTVPPQGQCTIYVGLLVWMRICVNDGQTELLEVPLAAPAMTWLGRNTMEGDLCYAAATHARLLVDAVPRRPWRAISPVRVRNERKEPLLLERFSLPTPLLSIYRDGDGMLWTNQTTVTVENELNTARLKVASEAPELAGHGERLTEPRVRADKGSLIRTVDRIFG